MLEKDQEKRHTDILRCEDHCFDTGCFQADNFQVDKFVAESKNRVPLAELREDLEAHYKFVRIALIDLINKDYADFVNLSSNLVGMEKNIQNLRQPLEQLWSQVGVIIKELSNEFNSIEERLTHRRQVKEKKIQLQHLLNVTNYVEKIEKILLSNRGCKDMEFFGNESSESIGHFLERVAGDFNQLQFHVNQRKGHPLVNLVRPRVSLITSKLQENLEASFYEGLVSSQSELVLRCLRTYALIDKTDHAEDLFRQEFVKVKLNTIISEDSFNSKGLEQICNSIIHFIKCNCELLLQLTSEDAFTANDTGKKVRIKGFNFMVNAIWPEIDMAFESRLPFIFSPGNPSLFFERYQTMMKFLKDFELMCGGSETVKRLRDHQKFKSFMAKWSLPVYFQIRMQKICCSVEAAIDKAMEKPKETSDMFATNLVGTIWMSLNECWDENILIVPLTSRFWKLSLQILSRLALFMEELTTTVDDYNSKIGDNFSGEMSGIIFVGQLIGDVSNVLSEAKVLFEEKIKPALVQVCENNLKQHQDVFEECLLSLMKNSKKLSDYCVKVLSEACTQQLEYTKNIPRLYRRTNKELPLQSSGFIASAFAPLKDFSDLKSQIVDDILEKTVFAALSRYYIVVHELVTSIKKTEESLQRLKRLRKGGESSALLTATNDMSDERKIRKQLFLDVNKFGMEGESIIKKPLKRLEDFKRLLELVSASDNTTGFQ